MYVFVLMPFTDEFGINGVYKDIIKPLFDDIGCTVERADELNTQQSIMKDILEKIDHADIILADLTLLNANVFYELGVSHALKKPTVMISQDVNNLPFDLRAYRTIGYTTRYNDVDVLKQRLREIVRKFRDGTLEFGNPVTDYIRHSEVIVDKEQSEVEEYGAKNLGIWDYAQSVEVSFKELTSLSNRLASNIINLTEKITRHRDKYNQMQSNGNPYSVAEVNQILKDFAADLMDFAAKTSEDVPKFSKEFVVVRDNATDMLSITQITNERDVDALRKFQLQLNIAREAIVFALNKLHEFRTAISQLRNNQLSNEVSSASQYASHVINELADTFELGISYFSRISNQVDTRLPSNV